MKNTSDTRYHQFKRFKVHTMFAEINEKHIQLQVLCIEQKKNKIHSCKCNTL